MRPLVGILVILLGWMAGAQPLAVQWTPEAAMRQAAEKLPSVQVARALLQSAQAYWSSIGAQPNPLLRLSGTVGEPVEEANALVFRFEIAGQPGLREQSAFSAAQARREELAQEKRLVALQVGLSYYSCWEKQEIFQIAQTRVELARSLERSSYRRFTVGEISQNSHLRAQLELARAQADLITARVDMEQAQGLLNLLLGFQVDAPIALSLNQEHFPASEGKIVSDVSRANLQTRLDYLPEIKALQHEVASQEAQTELARRGNAPELLMQFYRNRLGATDVQAVQVAVSIPLWDWGTVAAEVGRNEGLTEAARARIAHRHLLLEQKALEVSKRYQGALEREKILEEQALNFARLSADARRAYDANFMTLLEVFDVQQAYRQAMQTYITSRADVARTSLEMGALSPDGFFEEVSRVQP